MAKLYRLILSTLLLLAAEHVAAQSGTLDPTFGTGGKVLAMGNIGMEVNAVALQTDGKIVVAGAAPHNTWYAFAVARFTPDGKPDSSFGTHGIAIKPVRMYDKASAVAIQPDGKIVIGGSTNPFGEAGTRDFFILRFLSNGNIDSTFGGGVQQIAFMNVLETRDILTHLFIKPDGKILACGYTVDYFGYQWGYYDMVQLKPNGTPDSTFGTNGLVFMPGGGYMHTSSAALLASGKIINGGRSSFEFFGARRFNANGSIDASFGYNGVSDSIYNFQSRRVALQPDGKMVFIGEVPDSNSMIIALARLDSTGHIDNSFGTSGLVKIPRTIINVPDYGTGIHVLGNGQLLATGTYQGNFALLKFNSDGSLDHTFGTQGILKTPMGDSADHCEASIIQPADGKLLLVGHTIAANTGYYIAMARYEDNLYPLHLLRFSARKQQRSGILTWSTVSEEHVNRFEIERGVRGEEFSKIGVVRSTAQNAGINEYRYSDHSPADATNYYRLKIIDEDGSFTYSKIVALNFSSTTKLNIYPNPVRNTLRWTRTGTTEDATIQVTDAAGRILKHIKAPGGSVAVNIDVHDLAAGTYFIILYEKGGREVKEFVKVK